MPRGKSIKRQKKKSRRGKSVRKKKSRRRKSVRKRRSRRRKFRMKKIFRRALPYVAAGAVVAAAGIGAYHYFNRPLSRESLVDQDWVELEKKNIKSCSVPRPSGARKWYWFLTIYPKDPDSQRTLSPSSGYGAESKNVDINTVEKSRRYNSTSVLYAMMHFFFPYLYNNNDFWADGRRIKFSTDSSQEDEFWTYSIFLKLTREEFEDIQKLLREQWDISLYPRNGALGYLWNNLSDEEVGERSGGVIKGRVIQTSPERSYIVAGRFAKENIPELVKYENKLAEMYTLLNVLGKRKISAIDWPRHVPPYL